MRNLPRILIVEDEPAIAELIAVNLRHNGFQPIWAMDGITAQKELDDVLPDAMKITAKLPVSILAQTTTLSNRFPPKNC